jgi:3-hydroxyacyl-[acyl-carrier-protein] dehydratase
MTHSMSIRPAFQALGSVPAGSDNATVSQHWRKDEQKGAFPSMEILRKAIAGCALDEVAVLGDGSLRRRYRFQSGFVGFSGHFPGYPILPAFLQILTALTLVEEAEGHQLILESLKKAKFHMEIKPEMIVEVTCRERRASGDRTIEADLRVDEKPASAFSFVCRSQA